MVPGAPRHPLSRGHPGLSASHIDSVLVLEWLFWELEFLTGPDSGNHHNLPNR
jgi:hypothetical protein